MINRVRLEDALIDAIEINNLSLTRDLLKRGAEWGKRGSCGVNAIGKSISLRNLAGLRLLTEFGCDFSYAFGWYKTAAEMQWHEFAYFLNDLGLCIDHKNDRGETALIWKGKVEDWPAARFLIEHGANHSIAQQGHQAIHYAARNCDIKCLELLLSVGADPQALTIPDLDTPLHELGFGGEADTATQAEEVVLVLLLYGAKLAAKNQSGMTPLYCASAIEHLACIQALLKCGHGIDIATKEGVTALMIACLNRKTEAVRMLLKHDANAFLLDNEGLNAFHYATENADVLSELFAHARCCKSFSKAQCGELLHYATAGNYYAAVEVLLAQGWNPSEKDETGKTAIEIALELNDPKLIKLLTHG